MAKFGNLLTMFKESHFDFLKASEVLSGAIGRW